MVERFHELIGIRRVLTTNPTVLYNGAIYPRKGSPVVMRVLVILSKNGCWLVDMCRAKKSWHISISPLLATLCRLPHTWPSRLRRSRHAPVNCSVDFPRSSGVCINAVQWTGRCSPQRRPCPDIPATRIQWAPSLTLLGVCACEQDKRRLSKAFTRTNPS